MNPAAKNTTVKLVIQRIKASPNHTDPIRQIRNWQVAVLVDLPVNAQNKAAFSPFRLNTGRSEVAHARVGRRPDHHRLGRQGAAQTARHWERLPQPCLACAPSHLEPPEWPGSLCFCQVPLRLCSYCRIGMQLRMGTEVVQFVRNSSNPLGWV